MSTDRLQRLLPFSGALFAVVIAAGLTLSAGEPDNSSSSAKIYDYWHHHYGVQLVSNLLLIPFGVLFLLVFVSELRRALRSGEAGEATYSPIALGGGFLAAAGLAVTGTLGAAVATAAHHGHPDATYTLAQLQSYDWLPWMVGFAVLLLACGVGGMRTNALPKPVSIPAVVLGVACLTPVGYFALFLLPLWMLVASIALVRRNRPARAVRVATPGIATILLLLVAIAGASALVAATAAATSPGKNGKIVFRRYLNADHSAGALFVAEPDGSGVAQLTHPAAGRVLDNEPDWSPDGKQVVFQRADENACGDDSCSTEQIWVVNADGSGAHAVASDPAGKNCATANKPAGGLCRSSPAWSADGSRVIFSCGTPWIPGFAVNGGLCIVNADGSGTQTFLKTPKGMNDDGPQFSPDGKRIAFERAFDSPAGDTLKVAVFVMNADGSNARRTTPWSLRGGDHPDWSPDGKRILFSSNIDGPGTVSSNKYTVRPDGTGLHALTHATGGSIQWMSSSYSPDGKWITVARRSGTSNASIYVMHADGTHVRRIVHTNAWNSAPDWGSA